MTKNPTPVLIEGAVYGSDNGRMICRSCAGSSALYTGYDLSGMKVERITVAEVAEWLTFDLGPMRCECRKVTLSRLAGPDGWPMAVAGEAPSR